MKSTAQPDLDPQEPLPTGPTHIASRSTQTRASNAARAALVVADVTPTGYRVGVFMANHARYAKPSDIRRNVVPGELFTYWPQAKIAAAMGCSERQVRRGVRSMREAGTLEVRRRVRPCEASYVWVQPVLSGVRSDGACVLSGVRSDGACVLSDVRSGVLSGVRSHTEPRTEPQKNHVGSSRARAVCKICGNNWPAEYGTTCYECGRSPSTRTPADDEPTDEPKLCTCGDAYRQSYGRLCIDCKGKPSEAQSDAAREQDACRGVDDRGGSDGGEAESHSVPETETHQTPNGGEPGPNERQFKAELAKWTGPKRTKKLDRSDRRRLARQAQKEMADLAMGVDA